MPGSDPAASILLAKLSGLLLPNRDSKRTISQMAPPKTSAAMTETELSTTRLYMVVTTQMMPPSTSITAKPEDDSLDFLRAIVMSHRAISKDQDQARHVWYSTLVRSRKVSRAQCAFGREKFFG
jgi:hypothetical protein